MNSTLTREATRIVGGRVKREKIRELVAQAHDERLIDHLARASPRLVIKSGKLVADVSRSDRIGLVVGNTLGFSVMLLGVAGLMSPMILKTMGQDVGTVAGLLLMLQGVLVSLFGLFLLAQLDSLRMAKVIGPRLEELQREQTVAVQTSA